MRRLLIITPLALAACNSGPTVSATNASAADVAKQVDAATAGGRFVSPGHWEATMTMTDFSIPGMPAAAAQQMKAHMGKARAITTCLTPEEVKKPREDFFGGIDKSCRYDHFTMAGGKIDAVMRCKEDHATRVMTMSGTYGPDAYHMAMSSAASGGDGPMDSMAMKMTIDGKRTGACTGKEDG